MTTRTPVMDALVDFVLDLEPAALPGPVARAAERSLTDWLGTALAGAAQPLAAALAAVIDLSGGEPQATVVGRARRTSALLACLANGAQSHALDFDDTHLPSVVHGAAPVAPVVLALGEWRRRSGADVLAAYVAGFEVETRIGRVIGPRLTARGWHATGTLGHLGAAAAGGKLLGLDRARLAHALGIAGTQAAGLTQSFGTMSKPLHPGKAAMDGLLAALLAREGFTGPTAVLDGPGSLPDTLVGVDDVGAATDDLGKRFEILDNSVKLYAACHLTHATIDAARAIRADLAPAAGAVEAVHCRVHPLVLKVAAHRVPRTGLEAKFSVAFCAALGLVRGEAGEQDFAAGSLLDPALTDVMDRVTLEADEALPVSAASMTVRVRGGRLLERRVASARGTPTNPATPEDVDTKFRRLAGVVLPGERVARLAAAIGRLGEASDISAVMALAAG
jgi:2-methylcitrate dehydratase PrpD